MSFLKRLKPVSGSMVIDVDKTTLKDNANLSGAVIVNSNEAVDADEVKVDVIISEKYTEKLTRPVTEEKSVEVGGFKLPVKKKETRMEEYTEEKHREMHKETIRVAGPVKIKLGENRFPFSTRIPSLPPANPLSQVSLSLKSVMKVPKRPDMSYETYLPFQLEAQSGVREAGVVLDELFSNVGDVAEDVRSAMLGSGQTIRLHVKVESGGPFELLIQRPDGEILKTLHNISKEHEFEQAIPESGSYGFAFQSTGRPGAVRLKIYSKL
jgi:hypothetical protein